MSLTTWEYKVTLWDVPEQDYNDALERKLNEFGEKGWEFVAMNVNASGDNVASLDLVFKRPKN